MNLKILLKMDVITVLDKASPSIYYLCLLTFYLLHSGAAQADLQAERPNSPINAKRAGAAVCDMLPL